MTDRDLSASARKEPVVNATEDHPAIYRDGHRLTATPPMSDLSASPRTFTCARCGGTFDAERSDEECAAEYAQNFPEVPASAPIDVICEDCYQAFMQWHKRDEN